MGASAGHIDLDLNLNQQQFDRQMGGIMKTAKKAAIALGSIFAAKKIFDFGKQALELGSDLAEVQNVVDVTFTSMSKSVDEFAKNAAFKFGLSETMAKKYMGTFGAMSRAFGFSEKQAYDMSEALTGLAGDVASFYNLSQDEAYTKLKSVFTGETETLKDLGVVMTQSALDAYALANGYGKVTAKMTEAEKVALRFKFVQDQLSLANGDFERTSDGWANQVRILKLQFESFMATVGQGLINVFTPVIKVINKLMAKLIELANVFKAFTESFSSQKGTDSTKSATAAVEGMGAAAESTGDKVETAAKQSKSAVAGFDKLNKLSDNAGVSGAENLDLGDVSANSAAAEAEVKDAAGNMQSALEGLRNWVRDNFSDVFADAKEKITPHAEQLRDTFVGVADDVKSLGEPLKEWFAGDFTKLLKQVAFTGNDIIGGLLESFNMVFGDIWNVAVFPMLKKFIDVGLPILAEYCTEAVKNLGVLFGEIKRIFDAIWKDAVVPALEVISKVWGDVWDGLKKAWDKWGAPIFELSREAIKKTGDTLMHLWDSVLKPVVDAIIDMVSWLWDNHLKKLFNNVLNFLGELTSGILQLYNKAFLPLVNMLIDVFGPTLAELAKFIVNAAGSIIGTLADIANGIVTILTGIIEFIVGVFTGNWEKAWKGVVDVFGGLIQILGGLVTGIINVIVDVVNLLLVGIIKAINWVAGKINSIKFDVPDWVPGIGGKTYSPNIGTIDDYQIPKLATGAVIPPNREFLAMVGDQKNGVNIEAPLKTIEDALRNVIAERSGGKGENAQFNIYLDGREVARIMAKYNAGEVNRLGTRLIDGAI